MSLLAAHLDTPLSEPTKKFQWLHCLKWLVPNKSTQASARPEHILFQKRIPWNWASQNACSLSEHPKEFPALLRIPESLQPLLSIPKCFQLPWELLKNFRPEIARIPMWSGNNVWKECGPGQELLSPVLGPAGCLEPSRAQPGWALSSACSTRSSENTDPCCPGCLGTSAGVAFAGLMQQWLSQQNLHGWKWKSFSQTGQLGKKWCHSAALGIKSAGRKPIPCIWYHRNAFFSPQY